MQVLLELRLKRQTDGCKHPIDDIFMKNMIMGSSIKYIRKIFRKTSISNSLIRTPTYTYQGGRNVSFSENFAYVLNG